LHNFSHNFSRYIGRNSQNRPSLRNAYQHKRNIYIVEKYFQYATIPSLTMLVYLHSYIKIATRHRGTRQSEFRLR